MVNVSVLSGRLVATPELRKTPDNVSVTSFTLAVERPRAKKGEKRQADFIDCVAWRNDAEFITRFFQKGDMISLVGSLQSRNYTDKKGVKRKFVELVVDQASFCGNKKDNSSTAPNPFTEHHPDFEEIN